MTKCPDHPGVRMIINVEKPENPLFYCGVCNPERKRENAMELKALRELPTYNKNYGP